jgi:hypothetical protein
MRNNFRPAAALAALVLLATLLFGCSSREVRVLGSLPGTGAVGSAADPEKFVFFVFGDNRPEKKDDPPTQAIQDIATALALDKPAFALSCGDLIHGKAPDDRALLVTQYNAIFAVLQASGVPIHNAPGNHEMDDKDDVPNATMTQYYSELVGLPYGSFDYGNSHFIALNTEEVADPNTPKSPPSSDGLDPGYISPAQRQWLDEDLWAHQGAKHVFVFMHHSVHAFNAENQLDKASADALQAIFAKYPNVTAVFSAHEHLYYNPQAPDDLANPMAGSTTGPRYLVTGGAGAPLLSNDHGFYHYLVVTVDGATVTIQLAKL